MTEITIKQVHQVRQYLKAHPEWFAAKSNQATSWYDFNNWPNTEANRDHLIMPGELFMVDLVGTPPGTFWIVRLGKKEGRYKAEAKLSDNMHADYGDAKNGYWVVPKEAFSGA